MYDQCEFFPLNFLFLTAQLEFLREVTLKFEKRKEKKRKKEEEKLAGTPELSTVGAPPKEIIARLSVESMTTHATTRNISLIFFLRLFYWTSRFRIAIHS